MKRCSAPVIILPVTTSNYKDRRSCACQGRWIKRLLKNVLPLGDLGVYYFLGFFFPLVILPHLSFVFSGGPLFPQGPLLWCVRLLFCSGLPGGYWDSQDGQTKGVCGLDARRLPQDPLCVCGVCVVERGLGGLGVGWPHQVRLWLPANGAN